MSTPARRWWRDVATLVALVGLIATLLFNTLGVRQQVAQAKRERAAAELGLLTQLSGVARQAEARLVTVRDRLCIGRAPQRADQMALLEASQNYDYLAWLFNHGHVRMVSARTYWAPSMIETYELFTAVKLTDARRRVPELRTFKFRTPRGQWPPVSPNC